MSSVVLIHPVGYSAHFVDSDSGDIFCGNRAIEYDPEAATPVADVEFDAVQLLLLCQTCRRIATHRGIIDASESPR